MNIKSIQKDVVIVGGGMVGLSLALSLHQNGLQVAVVEAREMNYKHLNSDRVETRVSAINYTSKRLLQDLGVWNAIKSNRISPYYQMCVWDDVPSESITISAEEISEHSLGNIVENDVITQALITEISNTGIEIYANQRIEKIQKNGNTELVVLADKIVETSLIVGADGANSFVRDYFNFETKVKPYKHTAIVATLELEKQHNQTAYQRFYDKGVLAFLPLENPNKASIVWSVKTDYANFLMSLADEKFELELAKAINNTLGSVKLLSKRFSFELVQRHAKSYIKSNVVLVGDAAHTIHPLAGQGVNIGFKDVIALSKVVSEAFAKGRLIGHISTLDKYQRERKLDNTKMIALMKAFKEVFGSENDYIKKARRAGFEFVDKYSIVKSLVVKQAL
ncbi:UbiH/UbiF/VisC/COQ6 family ubiquinone biosynthesis hydroxylase [Francisella philomiragia]|uniref:2-octaprenyl-3-methyl-6-methoxy-1,4-benzoquinol hydroxylase n=1 Tax=Francisella philomiragia subsp. philomiragia (strain ATCC 25017 / CCUG 19701 / FSC 153 / O\|nr:UbiH/UbiF/VisC/COQ6 family ubiquinone biosynthesis hydroxylase [Francisella philomiragia]AJI48153.1 ubiquinone biosynthesis hydroxylase, UbiH/UbiF/VisC/COQ6 family protein [Francisella philomiragia]AJI48446.1 ubiquinone biosynthesis hydroxylase, UbiH/UbiF/VisC/COQ6 family protein [Francisella philomiragia]MBK2019889.1 UbiH/UbiF/VisC/COQ6 family ubiquinone biosynthesis hydroxylase [Francisella philomiragia]MBK2029660.1 UbiH/UbiF/VisC/COQ6 family ubiquinone biosynthesis hydroxylase [Francisell